MKTPAVAYDLSAEDAPIAGIHELFTMIRHPRNLWPITVRVLVDIEDKVVLVIMQDGTRANYSFDLYPLASEA